jgi:hypothetical protein
MSFIWYANVDISAVSGSGTKISPWNVTNLKNYLNMTLGNAQGIVSDGDTIRIRGDYNTNGTLQLYNVTTFSANNVTFTDWDVSIYGPWKMKSTNAWVDFTLRPPIGTPITINFKNLVVSDVVIDNGNVQQSTSGMEYFFNFRNSILMDGMTYSKTISASSPDNFYGCSFVSGSFNNWDYYYDGNIKQSRVNFYDSVFYNYEISAALVSAGSYPTTAYFLFDGCIFSGTSGNDIYTSANHYITLIDCQFGWSPTATFPNYEDINISAKNNLSYISFGLIPTLSGRARIGVNDYRKGIFGEPRQGKGAFYFGNDPIYFDLFCGINAYVGSGTIDTPFGGNDLTDFILLNPNYQFENETYCISGLKIVSASSAVNFDSAYGNVNFINIPNQTWKLVLTTAVLNTNIGANFLGVTLANGILHYENQMANPITFGNGGSGGSVTHINNMLINYYGNAYPYMFLCGQVINIAKGSTIISETSGVKLGNSNSYGTGITSATIIDSILDINNFYTDNDPNTGVPINEINLLTSGCVFKAPTVSALDALSGTQYVGHYRLSQSTLGHAVGSTVNTSACQFNWIPPIWPNDNAYDKSNYSYVALTSANPITISGTGNWN